MSSKIKNLDFLTKEIEFYKLDDIVVYNTDSSPYGSNLKKNIFKTVGRDRRTNEISIQPIEKDNPTFSFKTNVKNIISAESLLYNGLLRSEFLSNTAVDAITDYISAEKLEAFDFYKPYTDNKSSKSYTHNTSWYTIYDDTNITNEKEIKKVNKMSKVVDNNASAAKRGAMIAAGKTLNGVVKTQVFNRLPRKYKSLATNPLADVVLANVASFAVQNFASTNMKAKIATEAMMEAAMVDLFSVINLEQIITDVLSTVNIEEFANTTGI